MKESVMHLHTDIAPFSFTERWKEQKEFEPAPLDFGELRASQMEALASEADSLGNSELA